MNRWLAWLLIVVSVLLASCVALAENSVPDSDVAESVRESPLVRVERFVAGHSLAPLEPTRYTSQAASFELILPDLWSEHYDVIEATDADADALYPQAEHVVTFVYLPLAQDLLPKPLLAIYLFDQRKWETISGLVNDELGRLVAETEHHVYVAAIASEDGYPGETDDAALFARMLLSNQEVRDLIRVGDLDATTDTDVLVAATWTWQQALIADGSVTSPADSAAEQTYLLQFADDGQVELQAGCLVGEGLYTARDGRMQIELTTIDKAGCRPNVATDDAITDEFLTWLEQAAGFFFSDDELVIVLAMDSGSLHFVRVE